MEEIADQPVDVEAVAQRCASLMMMVMMNPTMTRPDLVVVMGRELEAARFLLLVIVVALRGVIRMTRMMDCIEDVGGLSAVAVLLGCEIVLLA